jgi:endonuclease YncB( thermonuclease family)
VEKFRFIATTNRFQRLLNALPLVFVVAITLFWVGQRFSPQIEDWSVLVKSESPQSQQMKLVPGSIYDGDTLRVTDGLTETKIRLCGIDAPEKEQPMGVAARDHLRSLVALGDGSVSVAPVERDSPRERLRQRYGRLVAEVFVKPRNAAQPEEEISLNAQMVADGFAYHYPRYGGGCPNGSMLVEIEEGAKEAKRGVWAKDNQRPWEYRQN